MTRNVELLLAYGDRAGEVWRLRGCVVNIGVVEAAVVWQRVEGSRGHGQHAALLCNCLLLGRCRHSHPACRSAPGGAVGNSSSSSTAKMFCKVDTAVLHVAVSVL